MDSFIEGLAEEGAKAILQLILVAALAGGAAIFARNWARRGKVWVTSCDPERFPVCPECKDIWESLNDGDEGDPSGDA